MPVVPVGNKNNLKVTLLKICKAQKRVNLVYLLFVYFFFVCLIDCGQMNKTEKTKH